MSSKLAKTFCLTLLVFRSLSAAPELNPGLADKSDQTTTESPLRRGEVIFFISYPFTFLASFIAYYGAATGFKAIDTGRGDFSPDGGFFALTALTAGILSLGIAIDDYHAIKAVSRSDGNSTTSYLILSHRF